MKLYTKTGDNGTSSLYTGMRVLKTSEYFTVLGDIDELNSNIGMVKSFITSCTLEIDRFFNPEWYDIPSILKCIQCTLMDVSSFIATPPWDDKHPIIGNTEDHLYTWIKKVGLDGDIIKTLEDLIDHLDDRLPGITNFVLPGNNTIVSSIHVCRSVSRRCERSFLQLLNSDLNYYGIYKIVDEQFTIAKVYLNRLSDFFFVLSRYVTMVLEVKEECYSRNKGLSVKEFFTKN